MSRPFELQGHRGARGLFPENTLEGFRGALAIGVSSLELDVAVTSDGVVVAIHDPLLNPDLARGSDGAWLDGPGPAVCDLRFADLAAYDVGRARPGGRVAQAHLHQQGVDHARIPTLDAVFEATAAAQIPIDVELKTDPLHPEWSVSPAEMADAVLASARRCGALERLAIRSFDWRGLLYLREVWPRPKRGWLTAAKTSNPDWWGPFAVPGRSTPASVAAAAQGEVDSCWAPHFADLSAELIADAHALGLRVVPWTVNEPGDMARLIGWDVDGFCTDRPDLARLAMSQAGLAPPQPFHGP